MVSVFLIAFSIINLVKGLMMFFFVLASVLLVAVILLQEPKGGGLSSAFGGAGAETFGVKTGGVNKFTSVVAAVFMGLALFYAAIRPETADEESVTDRLPPAVTAPGGAGETPTPPPGETPPPEAPPAETPVPPGGGK